MLELRKEIAGIVNISGHNVVTSEIASFVNAGSDKFRIFFKNGVEKEYNVKEANIAALEDAIIKAISHSKLPYGGEIRTMPRFDTFYGPHDMYPPHFNRPNSMPDYNSPYNGRHNPHINRPGSSPNFGRTYNDRYDNGFNNFSNTNTLGKLSVMDFETVKSDIENYHTLRNRILTTIFQQDIENGIVVPSFQEFKLANGMKDTWQLTEKYNNCNYAAILEIIEDEVFNFYYLLLEVKVKPMGDVR